METVKKELFDSYDGKGLAAQYSKYAERAKTDVNGEELTLTVDSGRVTQVGGKPVGVDAYTKAETDTELDKKANKSEMEVTAVSGDSTKKNIKLKDGLSQNVVVDISGKQDNLAFDGTYNASTNKVATVSTVEAAKCAVSYNEQTGEIHLDFRGTVE